MTYREIGISIRSAYTQGWRTMLHGSHSAQKRGSCSEMRAGRSKKNRWTADTVIQYETEKTHCTCIRFCSAA